MAEPIPPVVVTVLKCALLTAVLLTGFAYMTWFERRIIARIQWRRGPNRVGPWGLLQPLADGCKLLFKEQILPARCRPVLYVAAPCLSLVVALGTYSVIPWGIEPFTLFGVEITPWVADLNVGVVFLLGVASLGVYGIVLAGWSSGNRYALLGAIRSTAQVISYELTLGVALLSPVMMAGSLRFGDLVTWQRENGWFILWQPLAFLLFWIAGVAETNRAPFDLPEAEQELIAGYHTEYSGMRFALFFMAEYVAMITIASLTSVVFLGGAASPLGVDAPLLGSGIHWFVLKVGFFLFVYVWLRATFPRLRYDQLMRLGWQLLLPLGVLNLVLTALVVAGNGHPAGMLVSLAVSLAALALLGAWWRRPGPVAAAGA